TDLPDEVLSAPDVRHLNAEMPSPEADPGRPRPEKLRAGETEADETKAEEGSRPARGGRRKAAVCRRAAADQQRYRPPSQGRAEKANGRGLSGGAETSTVRHAADVRQGDPPLPTSHVVTGRPSRARS